ncbi:serine/threonine-protein kinase [Roseiconus lacunae]|uniref:serine/threonine-protein kinase n=1 Tax=Roseiconus lacunae TaxID=2605694 RepID=UPI001E4BA0C6|nr:serine/threonine-protein kinase [Roseiconus lacunae]MCD0460071.1 serine/threonine protein kinase [Roseiconus lacunae]
MPEYVGGAAIPILSRYDIELDSSSILGRGGMGVVFRARDRLMDRMVAIKTINPSLVDLAGVRESIEHRLFFREAMTHARLGILHPAQILPVTNYGIEDDTPFMEMDILEGGSLRDRMNKQRDRKRRGPFFDEEKLKLICGQLCDALKVLHNNKVYHSDLKPENILFASKGYDQLKVADLGLARVARSGLLTRAGLNTFAGGTMHYTPQEVTEGLKKATERTDLYSFGVILFELITREPLRWSQATSKFVEGHADLSPAAKDIIKRSCQLMGRNNFKSADDLQEKLAANNLLGPAR